MVMKTIRKSLAFALAIVMLFALWPGGGGVEQAEAATATPYLYRLPLADDDVFDDPDWAVKWGHPEMHYMNGFTQEASSRSAVFIALGSWTGDLAYCVQPGEGIPANTVYADQSEDSYWRSASDANPSLTKEEIKIYIGRILLYGYAGPLRHLRADGSYGTGWYAYVSPGVVNEHDLDCMAQAWATQYLIWETIIGERDEDFNHIDAPAGTDEVLDQMNAGHPARERMLRWYDAIAESVKSHRTVPSFAGRRPATAPVHTMTWDGSGYRVTLTDANGVLADYVFQNAEGVTCSREGNTMTFRSAAPLDGTVTLTAQRTGLSRGSALVWASEESQDAAIMTGTVEDPVPAYVKLETEAAGALKLIKTSEDGAVAGIPFTVTGPEGYSARAETDAEGTFTLEGLAPGEYTVTEQTPPRYRLQASQTVTVVPGRTAEVSFRNLLARASLLIVKRDDETLTTLEGAGFRLYDADMNQVAEGYTARRGRLTFSDLPLGDYFFREFEAPPGYALDDTLYPVTLDTDGATVMKVLRNVKAPVSLTVRKTDATGRPLAGIEMLLQQSPDGGASWTDVSAKTTDEGGEASWQDLSAGTLYRILETKTLPGLSLMPGPLFEGILEAGEEITVTAVNSAGLAMPFTGSASAFTLYSLALSALTAGSILLKRKKEENNT